MAGLNFAEIGEDVVDAEYPGTAEVVQIGAVLDLDLIRPKFEDYKKEAARIAAEAKALVVQDDKSLAGAVALGGNAKKIGKAIDLKRKEIIADPSEFVKGVNGLCKMITDHLDEAERVIKQKIGQHQAQQELERRERERKAAEEAAALQRRLDEEAAAANRKAQEEARRKAEEEAKAKKASEAETAEAIRKAEEEAARNAVQAPTVAPPVVQEAPRVTRTESGSAFSKAPWKFEITDETQVPRPYLCVDEKKIRDAVRMGTREIAGVRIFQETQINFRT